MSTHNYIPDLSENRADAAETKKVLLLAIVALALMATILLVPLVLIYETRHEGTVASSSGPVTMTMHSGAATMGMASTAPAPSHAAMMGAKLSGMPVAGGRVIDVSATGAEGGKLGSDGKRHDTISPSNFTIPVGTKITLVIKNSDDMMHSITSPELGLNLMIKPGMNHFTFTASKRGTFRWYCVIPCDTDSQGWAMMPDSKGPGQTGFMAGSITVV